MPVNEAAMTNEQLDALLPCPFCGGEAQRDTLGPDEFGNEGGDVIECSTCGASSHVEFGRKEGLVSAWNRRTDTTLRARAEAAEADAERLAGALASVIAACRQARMTPKPRHGIGGMTIEANIRGSQYNGVSAWPIEEADEVLSAHNERMKG